VIVRTPNVYPMRKLILLLVVLAAAVYGVGTWLFLLHKDDPLPARGVDAVVVLAGSKVRLPVALDLIRRHVASTLVVSETDRRTDPPRYALCHGPKPRAYRLVCERADPFSTRGEARLAAALATRNHWRSLAVVSSRYHLFRARILFARCTPAKLVMRGADGDTWWWKTMSVPAEWVKLVRSETIRRSC
jgi:uncharacterized SAM-binding protein YcdF (DUF218 family)